MVNIVTIFGPDEDSVGGERAASRHDDNLLAHRTFLTCYIRKNIRDAQDIDDCVQDVYLRVIKATKDRAPVLNWRGMLKAVANSVIIDRHRHDAVHCRDAHAALDDEALSVADPLANPEALAERRMKLARIQHILNASDDCCRQAFVMARVHGFSHKDVADRLGIGVVSVSRCIEKILARLARAELSAADGEDM